MTDAGDWLISTAKRNPEALLVLAAGCALLLRGGRSSYRAARELPGGVSDSHSPWNISPTAADKASAIGNDIKDRIADTGSSLAEQGREMARTVSTQTSQIAGQAQSMLSGGFEQVLREQPLALVAAGFVAGAAVAALLPATDLEERTLGSARDAISDMAGKAGENLVAAATGAGQQLAHGVAERATEGFKEVAKDVVGQFTEKVTGATEKPSDRQGNVSPPSNRAT
jgi:hypothetical protein